MVMRCRESNKQIQLFHERSECHFGGMSEESREGKSQSAGSSVSLEPGLVEMGRTFLRTKKHDTQI